jgi:hypothetical protein
MSAPRQLLDESIRPAELLLRVYRLLDCESLQRDGEMVQALRGVVGASASEDLMLIYNEIFVGLVRESAQLAPGALRRSALQNLLRQAVVVASTAQETYLPALLRENLPKVVGVRGRDFLPKDKELANYFAQCTFSVDEMLRPTDSEDTPLFIANKLIRYSSVNYLGGIKGVHTVGLLLTVPNPWAAVAARLGRSEEDLKTTVKDATNRRNDIVHRGDRPQGEAEAEIRSIAYPWAKQAVETVHNVCMTLDDLVAEAMAGLQKPASN